VGRSYIKEFSVLKLITLSTSGADSLSVATSRAAKKITGGRDSPLVRNLPYHLWRSRIWGQWFWHTTTGAGVSSKPVDWEPVIRAYHHRELVVPADPWIKVIVKNSLKVDWLRLAQTKCL
jgi:hypothetical protein